VPSLRLALAVLAWLLALSAWLVARRDRRHRWLALYLSWLPASDLLRAFVLEPLRGGLRPYAGVARVAWHADQLVVLSWSFAFVALCLHHFAARRPTLGWATGAFAWLLCLSYPLVTNDVLGWVYRAAGLWCLAVSWACILWGMARRRDLEAGLTHLSLMLLAAVDVALNLVPFARDYFGDWPLVRWANLALRAVLLAAHLVWLARRREGQVA